MIIAGPCKLFKVVSYQDVSKAGRKNALLEEMYTNALRVCIPVQAYWYFTGQHNLWKRLGDILDNGAVHQFSRN